MEKSWPEFAAPARGAGASTTARRGSGAAWCGNGGALCAREQGRAGGGRISQAVRAIPLTVS